MSNERLIGVIRAPHVSEKSARLQEVANQFVFEVAPDATKHDVKAAVESMFKVKVESVSLLNARGKRKAFRGRSGTRGGWRKAYVSLGGGQTIDLVAKA